MNATERQPIQIGSWMIVPAEGCVRRDDEIRKVRPRAMDVFLYLVDRAGEVVTNEEMIAALWAPAVVGDDAIQAIVGELRKALDDDSRHPQYIATIPKRGYQFVGEVVPPQTPASEDSGVPLRFTDTIKPAASEPTFRFGDWLVEPGLNRISQASTERLLEPLTMNVLGHLVRRPGEVVSTDELLDRFWSDRHAEPGMVARCIAQIRKALDDDAKTPRYIQTITKKGYRAIAQVEEATQAVAEEAETISPQTRSGAGRIGRYTAILGTVLAIGITTGVLFGTGLFSAPDESQPTRVGEPIVAVLPFQNFSDLAENAFFADGIHEDVLSNLSKIRGLRVISRTSVLRYRNSSQRLPELAAELGADYVLEGSVRRDADRVRISVQLIEAARDHHVWAENYDRELTDIFKVQSEVAKGVAAQMQVALSRDTIVEIEQGTTASTDAYALFLKGRALAEIGGSANLNRALSLYDEAIAIDWQYALAYAYKARAYRALTAYGGEGGGAFIKDRGFAAARRAYELDSTDPDVLMSLAMLYTLDGPTRFDQQSQYVDEALAVAPNHIRALAMKVAMLSNLGRHKEAADMRRHLITLDPLDRETNIAMAGLLRDEGRNAEADAQVDQTVRLFPDVDTYRWAAGFYANSGDVYQNVAYLRKGLVLEPTHAVLAWSLGLALYWLGDDHVWRQLADQIASNEPNNQFEFYLRGLAGLRTGDDSLVNEWLERDPNNQFVRQIRVRIPLAQAHRAYDEQRFADSRALRERHFELFQEWLDQYKLDGELVIARASPFLDAYAMAAKSTGREDVWRETTDAFIDYLLGHLGDGRSHFQLTMLYAMRDDIPRAVHHFKQVRNSAHVGRADWLVTSIHGVLEDRYGLFNGLGEDPDFRQTLEEYRAYRGETLAKLRRDFPDLFGPSLVAED